MKNLSAKLISFLLHPLLLPSWGILLMFSLPGYMNIYPFYFKKYIFSIIFLGTGVIPAFLILLITNAIGNTAIDLPERKKRNYPYFVTIAIYTAMNLILQRSHLQIPPPVLALMLITTTCVCAIALINLKFKISAHMAGIGTSLSFLYIFILRYIPGIIYFQNPYLTISAPIFFSLLILLTGSLASARLFLGIHTPKEVYIGLLVGFCIGFLHFMYL